MFLEKGVLKICTKFTGEHPCQSAISIKLQSNFIEITLRHGCSPVNLLHIFRTPFSRNTTGCLLLNLILIRENPLFLLSKCKFFFQISLFNECKIPNIMKRPQILAVVSVGYVQIFLKKLSFNRSSRPEVFLGKGVLKICSKFTGEHSCRSAISIRDNTHMTFMKIGQFSRRPTVK